MEGPTRILLAYSHVLARHHSESPSRVGRPNETGVTGFRDCPPCMLIICQCSFSQNSERRKSIRRSALSGKDFKAFVMDVKLTLTPYGI